MNDRKFRPSHILLRPTKFLWSAVISFRANQGVLLSGAVAYHTLLSVVPILTLALVALTHIVEEEQLLAVLSGNLEIILPGQSQAFAEDEIVG